MKIIIDRSDEERQSPIITIDTTTCHYPYAVREAIELALKLDGYTQEMMNDMRSIINEVIADFKSII